MAILIGVWESILVLAIIVSLTVLALWWYWRRRLIALRQDLDRQYQEELDNLFQELDRQRQKELADLRQELDGQHQAELTDLRRELDGQRQKELADLRQEWDGQHQKELDDLRQELNRQHQIELDDLRQEYGREHQTEIRDMIGQFRHQASHCLRPIKDNLRQIKDSVRAQAGADAMEWYQTLGASLREIDKYEWRLTRLIENMAFVSYLESLNPGLPFSEVKLDVIVSDVVSEFNESAEDEGIMLAWWAVPERFPRMMANEEGLRQVFINLIDNAINYCQEGDEIDVALEANEDKNVIYGQVSDTGPGIPEEDLKLIFQKGYTVEAARGRKPKEGSQGLGLYIVKLVVEKHGGTIDVTSELGKGTTFTITLPIQRI
jgi:signal transduction histidine kinase